MGTPDEPTKEKEIPSIAARIKRFVLVASVTWTLATLLALATETTAIAIVSFAIQWAVFALHAGPNNTEKFYDLTGSCTYLSLIVISCAMSGLHTRQLISSMMVCIWCVRLGSFLFQRIKRDGGEDKRFTVIKKDPLRFFNAWNIQGLWVLLTALPVFIVNMQQDQPPISVTDIIGWSVWVIGFGIEVTADSQKNAFRADEANKGRFITTGLWEWSRHPNYFGEIMLWTGLTISSASVFRGSLWLGTITPLFVYCLINFVSGVPMLEKSSDKKWGGEPAYEQYKAQTPVLMLRPSFMQTRMVRPKSSSGRSSRKRD